MLNFVAPRIHPRFLPDYLSQHRTTLRELTLYGVIELAAKDLIYVVTREATAIRWPERFDFEVPMRAQFLLAAGAQVNELPRLALLELLPCKFCGAAAPGPLLLLLELTDVSLTGFLLLLQPTLLRNVAMAAPRLRTLRFSTCKIVAPASESQRFVIRALTRCLMDRTDLPADLSATIDAPTFQVLRVDSDDPRAVRNDLSLLGRVKWVNNQLPVLVHVTQLGATADVVNAIVQIPHTLPDVVHLNVVPSPNPVDDDVLHYLLARPLTLVSVNSVHPRVLAAILALPKETRLSIARVAKADRGTPIDMLELIYDQDRFPWAMIPLIVPRDKVLAKKIVVKVVYAPDVAEAVKDIGAALRAFAGELWTQSRPQARRGHAMNARERGGRKECELAGDAVGDDDGGFGG
ncbi:hypothetical protein GGF32_005645 [Allomyces javanicus]|nr:hypothetical protein GGF32_005645 [Allomyces javanicus]